MWLKIKCKDLNRKEVWTNGLFLAVACAFFVIEKRLDYKILLVLVGSILNLGYELLDINNLNKLTKYANARIKFNKIKNKFPKLKRIGIIGLSNSGKTTLIENLVRLQNSDMATSQKSAYLLELAPLKDRFAFLIDDRGSSQACQNNIIKDSNFLIILIDHNSSSDIKDIDE